MHRNVTATLPALLVPAFMALAGAAGCASTARTAGTPVSAPAAAKNPAVDQRMLGSAAAQVMIIEFTDLQCPYCARFARDTWPLLRQRYVDTGKVRFATRDLPLPMHEFALPAAVAARCAGQQGKFWEYREALFRDQSLLSQGRYAELAAEFGLDSARFENCRADPTGLAAVRADAGCGECGNRRRSCAAADMAGVVGPDGGRRDGYVHRQLDPVLHAVVRRSVGRSGEARSD